MTLARNGNTEEVFSLMSWRTWGIILLSFLLITFFEGVVSWRRKQVQPLLGAVGSLQFEALQNAACINAFVDGFIQKHGLRPTQSADPDSLLQQQWKWDETFSKGFDADVKDGLRSVLRKLEREGQHTIDVQNAVSLATISLDQVLAAYTALIHLSFRLRSVEHSATVAGV